MAARKNRDHKVALFPFLSVLICTIGVLTLILISSVLGQVDAVVDTAQKHEGIVHQLDKINHQIEQWKTSVNRKQQQLADLTAEITALEELLGELGLVDSPEAYRGMYHALKQTRQDIEDANDNIKNIRIQIEAADPDGVLRGNATPDALNEVAGLREKFNAKDKELNDLIAKIGALIKIIKGIEDEIAEAVKKQDKEDPTGVLRKTPLARRQLLKQLEDNLKRTNAEIERLKEIIPVTNKKIEEAKANLAKIPEVKNILFGGAGIGFKARYVECTKDGVRLDPNLKDGRKLLDLDDNDDKRAFRKHAQMIHSPFVKGVRLVFLIRPSGVKSYEKATESLPYFKEPPGYLPLPSEDLKIPIQAEEND